MIYFRKKITEISNLMKIHPVVGELFHANGQTYMTESIVAFFANLAKSSLNKTAERHIIENGRFANIG